MCARLHPTPIVELNRAVAVSTVDGRARALDLVDSLAARGEVADYHLLHATRGNLLPRLGRKNEAREAYEAAPMVARLDLERRLLQARIAETWRRLTRLATTAPPSSTEFRRTFR